MSSVVELDVFRRRRLAQEFRRLANKLPARSIGGIIAELIAAGFDEETPPMAKGQKEELANLCE